MGFIICKSNITMSSLLKDQFEREMGRLSLLRPLDVLLVGGTGTGKSSTLNSLFGSTVAKVGDGVDPETQNISGYQLHDYLRIHDSAGLGDGKNSDLEHAKNITYELLRTISVHGKTYKFMDLVLVLLDGGQRDMGTAFKILESVVLKAIEPERVIVAINQADMAMKGRGWDPISNSPDKNLRDFLNDKSISAQKRIYDSTGLSITRPVYYSALYNFNIDGLMQHIIQHLPRTRRE